MAARSTGSPGTRLDPARRGLDAGRLLAALGALLLLVSLFLDWFGIPGEINEHEGISAWTTFELVDLLLAACALAALAPLVQSFLAHREPPLVPERVAGAAGLVALLLVLLALVNHPPAANGFDPELGLWLALAGALAMAIGGVLSVARVSLVVAPRDDASPASSQPAATAATPPTSEPPRAREPTLGAEAPTETLGDDPGERPPGI